MSRCRRCNVEILDNTQICPLCHNVLEEGEPRENTYPDARVRTRRMKLVSNILLFVTILLGALLGYINYFYLPGVWWSLISGAGLIYLYLIFRLAVIGNSGYKTKIIVMTITGVLYVIMIDIVIGYQGWSVNYILPGGIMLIGIGIGILMIVNHRNWQSYLLFQIFMIVCSIAPLILMALHIVTKPQMSVLAFGFSIFLFLGTLIIGDRRARIELKRRFHVR